MKSSRAWPPDTETRLFNDNADYHLLQKGVRLAPLHVGKGPWASGHPLQRFIVLGGDDGRINVDVLVQRDLGDRGVVLRVCNTSVVLETEMTHTMAPAVVVARKCAETTWTMARLCEGRGASASGDVDYMLYRAVS